MHISWKCSNCSEEHVSIINNLHIGSNSKFNLKCNNCNSEFNYIINSIKYSAKCVITDTNTNIKSSDIIIAF